LSAAFLLVKRKDPSQRFFFGRKLIASFAVQNARK
jgi:hypothetical protein